MKDEDVRNASEDNSRICETGSEGDRGEDDGKDKSKIEDDVRKDDEDGRRSAKFTSE